MTITVFLRHFKNWVRAPTLPKFSNQSTLVSTQILIRCRNVHEIEIKTHKKDLRLSTNLRKVCDGRARSRASPILMQRGNGLTMDPLSTYEHSPCFLVDYKCFLYKIIICIENYVTRDLFRAFICRYFRVENKYHVIWNIKHQYNDWVHICNTMYARKL